MSLTIGRKHSEGGLARHVKSKSTIDTASSKTNYERGPRWSQEEGEVPIEEWDPEEIVKLEPEVYDPAIIRSKFSKHKFMVGLPNAHYLPYRRHKK